MATTTIELRHLLNSGFKLFDFEYTFDDVCTAKEIEKAVIGYFYTHEIGRPTPDDFKRVFVNRWTSAMLYYNKLHNTTLLEYNPLINYKMNESLEQLRRTNSLEDLTSRTDNEGRTNTDQEIKGKNDSTRTEDSATNTADNEKLSDYPQQPIAGGDYLSGERTTEQETTTQGTTQDSGTDERTTKDNVTSEDSTQSDSTTTAEGIDNTEYEKNIEGITGVTYQELIEQERQSILRLTGMIIEEMKPCFLLVY